MQCDPEHSVPELHHWNQQSHCSPQAAPTTQPPNISDIIPSQGANPDNTPAKPPAPHRANHTCILVGLSFQKLSEGSKQQHSDAAIADPRPSSPSQAAGTLQLCFRGPEHPNTTTCTQTEPPAPLTCMRTKTCPGSSCLTSHHLAFLGTAGTFLGASTTKPHQDC